MSTQYLQRRPRTVRNRTLNLTRLTALRNRQIRPVRQKARIRVPLATTTVRIDAAHTIPANIARAGIIPAPIRRRQEQRSTFPGSAICDVYHIRKYVSFEETLAFLVSFDCVPAVVAPDVVAGVEFGCPAERGCAAGCFVEVVSFECDGVVCADEFHAPVLVPVAAGRVGCFAVEEVVG